MASIVRDTRSNEHYILLSASFSVWKDTHPSFWGGNLFPNEESGQVATVAVADRTGRVLFLEAQHVTVVSVDGMHPADLLDWKKAPVPTPVPAAEPQPRASTVPTMDDVEQVTVDICPSCGAGVLSTERVCPSCDLTLIVDEE